MLHKIEIDMIAEAVVKRLMKLRDEIEQEEPKPVYLIYDEFGNQKAVSEKEFLEYEIEGLTYMMDEYVKEEKYKDAANLKEKIKTLHEKLSEIYMQESRDDESN